MEIQAETQTWGPDTKNKYVKICIACVEILHKVAHINAFTLCFHLCVCFTLRPSFCSTGIIKTLWQLTSQCKKTIAEWEMRKIRLHVDKVLKLLLTI